MPLHIIHRHLPTTSIYTNLNTVMHQTTVQTFKKCSPPKNLHKLQNVCYCLYRTEVLPHFALSLYMFTQLTMSVCKDSWVFNMNQIWILHRPDPYPISMSKQQTEIRNSCILHYRCRWQSCECRPIFKILSLTDSQEKSLCIWDRKVHLTFTTSSNTMHEAMLVQTV